MNLYRFDLYNSGGIDTWYVVADSIVQGAKVLDSMQILDSKTSIEAAMLISDQIVIQEDSE